MARRADELERTEEEFSEDLEEEFAPPEEEATPEPEAEAPPEPEEPEPEQPQTVERSPEEMDAALRTLRWAQENPERWEKILHWEQQGYVDYAPPPSEPARRETEDEEIDDDLLDPTTKQMQQRLERLEQELESERRFETQQAFEGGLKEFRGRYDSLDDTQFDKVLQTASDLKLVEQFARKFGRTPEAMDRALDAAYKMTFFDEARQQTEQQAREEVAKEARKRKRASAVGQGSGSASRAPAEPKTRDERIKVMSEEIAEAMQ